MAKNAKDISREDVKSNLDELYSNVENFRESESFQQMLDFVSSFKKLSPYNAFLLYQQRPGAKYVLNAAQWLKLYKRKIKPNARPLIILVPFGPVDYVYDISDTYSPERGLNPSLFDQTDDEFLESIIEPYKTSGYEPRNEMNSLELSMMYQGILLEDKLNVGNSYAGQIEVLTDYHPVMMVEYKKTEIPITANYLLSVRDKAKWGEKFATVIHELGHLFCHHLSAVPSKAWTKRNLDHTTEEFEAEAVSYIICTRYGVLTPSAEYLRGYYQKNKNIPAISVETVFTACNTILNMIENMTLKQGIVYKHDDKFKKLIDSLKEK